ncbi:MAG TPA: AMP-binding protein, partial [Burkholderiaceae bacterium]|nr:AMP-binding protein [Burkholderiaceae bacterium]
MNTVNLLPSATAQSTLDSRFHAFGWGPEAEIPFQCIHHAIDTQIALQPQAVAVEHLDHSISYADLDRLASSLAARLAADGVRQGDAVGLFMRRGIHLVVGILAVLRLGAAYVPKDAAIVPHTMLQQVIDGARIRTVLTTRDHVDGLAADLARANLMQVDLEQLAQDRASAPAVCGDRSDRCFVLFTSGTTGVPNGVEVTHANVCNLLLCSPGDLGIRAGTRVGNVLNIAFDMASWEILACLANGGTLVVRGSDFAACAAQVNVLIATPSILARLNPEDCPTMEAVAVAGEPCPQPLAEKWAAKCRFYIGCGPTEVTIVNTLGQYHCGDDAVTIGAPVPNTTVYVLDENLRPCAIGEVGEMWAGGD